jgi:hypothetical protein
MTTISQSCRYSRKKAQLVPANQTVERPRSIQPFPPRNATARAIGETTLQTNEPTSQLVPACM